MDGFQREDARPAALSDAPIGAPAVERKLPYVARPVTAIRISIEAELGV